MTSYTSCVPSSQKNITEKRFEIFMAVKRFSLRVVTGEKNSPTVAHACRKRRLKWVLPQVGGWSTGLATLSL
jgi:hypothetical protein